METVNQAEMQNQEATTQEDGQEQSQQEAKKDTFTQEDVNRMIQKRVAKYADYEALKEKAAKLDELEEANKTELQKATERAEELEKQLEALKTAELIRTVRDEVSQATGVPAGLLTAETKEDCEEQARQILTFAKKPAYPQVKDAGEAGGNTKKATRDQFAEWLDSQK